ncbi:Myb/SANT-like DNA-binding domain-containing protein [Trichoderma longibrachiatum]
MSEEDLDLAAQDAQGPGRVDRDRRAPRFSWTPAYEATFFRSLCESVQLGMRENSSFKAEAWERAMLALQEHHGAYPAKSHLINKSDNARKRFRLWRGLREDPDFVYNPVTRTVTATEEAWRAHIEREPLSRALRGRPFDHEEYMEVLYPDVVGSGGAPKRIMKPRRKTDGQPCDETEMPGTGVLNLQTEPPPPLVQEPSEGSSQQPPPPQPQPPPHKGSLTQAPTAPSSAAGVQPRPTTAPSIPRNLTIGQGSALTPPDESVPQSRKRPSPMGRQSSGDLAPSAAVPVLAQSALPTSPEKRRRLSSRDDSNASISTPTPLLGSSALSRPALEARSRSETQSAGLQTIIEELSKTSRARMWKEEAVDILFKEFANEDADLQIHVSENVLSDEHKAMVFCKMPLHLRQHWVRKHRGPAS